MLFEFLATFTNYFNVIDLFTDIIFLSQTQESVENEKLDIFLLSTIFNTSFFVINVFLIQVKTIFNIKLISFAVLNTAFKFIILIALLIFVRGGIPRYRYDFLTKVG